MNILNFFDGEGKCFVSLVKSGLFDTLTKLDFWSILTPIEVFYNFVEKYSKLA
ncbi:MAG: hypothetical protein US52_C0041G0007 [candidate division WS6 bacterium GW2011_GWA2_37_6]|uniref:Uncharacterized protein n=1 Tax=candidate division WS6 bacterium GW2011_GWA2_37_6 TaxID=1619087 RepID=A0A0G0K2R6_9BACT|nr:MAG: hypothetical protein US52_C0041G0007 [candidate division WS6 bacterium GW2011_GWA2_37_6]